MQFPEWMKPDLVNVIINQVRYKDINYYALIESGSPLDVKVLSWMIQWALNNNQNLMYYIEGGVNRIGSKEFREMPT
jgi:argonaute-like protein implicated in RNA metabolism and viral defense